MNSNVLGIIFPNSYDALVPELTSERLMASVPFAGRYRMIDFILSSMVNAGIDNISIVVRENYLSLMDHLGSGREWDLTRKNGGLNIIPPFARKDTKIYNGRIGALANLLVFLKQQKEKYVVMADSHIAVNFNFKAMIDQHIANNADITIAYEDREIPEAFLKSDNISKGLYYTLQLDGDDVKAIKINSKENGVKHLGMNIYIAERELLIDLVSEAFINGQSYFERDILIPNLETLKIQGYKSVEYAARLTCVKAYFDENMKLLSDENLDALFRTDRPIYTKVRDDNPTRYIKGAKVKNTMSADGCVIEGTVENSVLFKGVKIGKGAVVKNCVVMQDSVIEDGAKIEYLITDKDVTISPNVEMKGSKSFPIYIAKAKTV